MKVALVHDDFTQVGGAENLFAEIASLYPNAPIYTSLVNWQKLPPAIDKSRIYTSFMQKIPFATKFYKLLLPLYPFAFESFYLSNFDLAISSTTRFAKGVITRPKTIHICYINSVPRFLWDEVKKENYLSAPVTFLISPILNFLKRWDKISTTRVDFFIANSQNVADSVKKIYGRQAEVVYPFADTDFFNPARVHNWKLKNQKYYLIVSRLVRWKKIEIAIEACQSLGLNLKIVGTGPDASRLKRLSTINYSPREALAERGQLSTIEFLQRVPPEKLRELYQNAQALIVTQDEDFGIAAAEAQACGIPIIAYNRGGQKEIVQDGITGLFFNNQTPDSLEDAIRASSEVKWNLQQIRENALRFSKKRFGKQLKSAIAKYANKNLN